MRMHALSWSCRIGLAAALTLLSGCALLAVITGAFEPPELRILGSRLDSLTTSSLAATVSLELHNPNPFPLEVEGLRYSVRIDNSAVIETNAEAAFSLASGASRAAELPVSLSLASLRDSESKPVATEIPYEVRAFLTVRAPLLERQIELPQRSVLRVDVPLGLAFQGSPGPSLRLASPQWRG